MDQPVEAVEFECFLITIDNRDLLCARKQARGRACRGARRYGLRILHIIGFVSFEKAKCAGGKLGVERR